MAELSRRLRRAAETATAGQWVEAELGAVKQAPSGHAYLTLKDEREDAVIEAVMYRTAALRVARFLFQGSRVQVWGQATVWAPRGRLQFVIERLRPQGRGALLESLERLKQQLLREGLFRAERKRPLPEHPTTVGVVTSGQGAVWHDIQKVASRRGAVRLLLAPAVVQGEQAPESIVAALRALDRVAELDVVIVARGGGSFEDLMAFNDERVVRAVVAMRCPVVSAVGHEVDVSLCDLAADVRAATPSEAAELVVADTRAAMHRLQVAKQRLARAMKTRVLEDRHALHRLHSQLSDPRFVLAEKQQALDEWFVRLERSARRLTGYRRSRLVVQERKLAAQHPRAVLMRARAVLDPLVQRLKTYVGRRLTKERSRSQVAAAQLVALSPLAVLARGYAIALKADGMALRRSLETEPGACIRVLLHEGSLLTKVEAIEKEHG